MQRARVRESIEMTLQRFLHGLKLQLKSIVRHHKYETMNETHPGDGLRDSRRTRGPSPLTPGENPVPPRAHPGDPWRDHGRP